MYNDNEYKMQVSLAEHDSGRAKIKVIGVGGGGGNALDNMINNGLKNVGFIAINTDRQALDNNSAPIKICIGEGLGAGGDPKKAEEDATKSKEAIQEAIKNTDMIFITSGMGGGTGTGASPVIANYAREMGILVVAIVTTPFPWEGRRRLVTAYTGIKQLRDNVDAIIVIHNKQLVNRDNTFNSLPFKEAFEQVNQVLLNATKGITDIIFNHALINVDFADVKAITINSGNALMGIGVASGENRAEQAAKNALKSPFLDNNSIKDAKGVLVKLSGQNVTVEEMDLAMNIIREAAGVEIIEDYDEFDLTMDNYDDIDDKCNSANVIWGLSDAPELGDKMQVTLIATGLQKCKETGKTEASTQNAVTEEKQTQEPVLEEAFVNEDDAVVTSINDNSNPFKPTVNFRDYNYNERKVNNREIAVPRGNMQLTDYDMPATLRRNGTYNGGMLRDI